MCHYRQLIGVVEYFGGMVETRSKLLTVLEEKERRSRSRSRQDNLLGRDEGRGNGGF